MDDSSPEVCVCTGMQTNEKVNRGKSQTMHQYWVTCCQSVVVHSPIDWMAKCKLYWHLESRQIYTECAATIQVGLYFEVNRISGEAILSNGPIGGERRTRTNGWTVYTQLTGWSTLVHARTLTTLRTLTLGPRDKIVTARIQATTTISTPVEMGHRIQSETVLCNRLFQGSLEWAMQITNDRSIWMGECTCHQCPFSDGSRALTILPSFPCPPGPW